MQLFLVVSVKCLKRLWVGTSAYYKPPVLSANITAIESLLHIIFDVIWLFLMPPPISLLLDIQVNRASHKDRHFGGFVHSRRTILLRRTVCMRYAKYYLRSSIHLIQQYVLEHLKRTSTPEINNMILKQ